MTTTAPAIDTATEFYSGEDLPPFLNHWVRSSVPTKHEGRNVRMGQLIGSEDVRTESGEVISTALYFTHGDPQVIRWGDWDGDDTTAPMIERTR